MNDQKFARAREILADLVRFPTISASSNLDVIDYLRTFLSRSGVQTTPIFNAEHTKANLFAVLGPREQKGGVLLSGHTDVVPVEGQPWTSDPFCMQEREGKLFGRGTCDMKGFIACVLAQVETLPLLTRPLQLVFSFDEEIGCVGVRSVLDNFSSLAAPPDLILIGEPTMMQPVIAHKGKITGHIRCKGHECHSSQAPEGLNAIHLASDMLVTIQKLQATWAHSAHHDPDFTVPYSTVHVGTIQGGTAINIVPADCAIGFEIRHIPTDCPDRLIQPLFDAAARLTRKAQSRFRECGVEIDITNRYPGLIMDEDAPSLAYIQSLVGSQHVGKVSFGTEAGLFQQALQVPTYVCGPGDIAQAHKPDEFLSLDQLAQGLSFVEKLSTALST